VSCIVDWDSVNPKFGARNTKEIQMSKIRNSKPGISLRLIHYFVRAVLLIIAAGCGSEQREPEPVFTGEKTIVEALSILRSRSQNTVPMKANGQCLWQTKNNGKVSKENFAVKIWLNPPREVYLQGDIAFNPRGIVLGSNAGEFWLLVKPEASQYSWGKWAEQETSSGLMVVPKSLDEALGIVEVNDGESWLLSHKGEIDVLAKRDDKGDIIKKVYVNRSDYLVRKIEYFDVIGKAVAIAEMDKYREVSEGFFVPTFFRVMMPEGDSAEASSSITLNLNSVKSTDFSDKQRSVFFTRPPTKGYEHIYRIINGQMVEQSD
jgi:hypothetical protein